MKFFEKEKKGMKTQEIKQIDAIINGMKLAKYFDITSKTMQNYCAKYIFLFGEHACVQLTMWQAERPNCLLSAILQEVETCQIWSFETPRNWTQRGTNYNAARGNCKLGTRSLSTRHAEFGVSPLSFYRKSVSQNSFLCPESVLFLHFDEIFEK